MFLPFRINFAKGYRGPYPGCQRLVLRSHLSHITCLSCLLYFCQPKASRCERTSGTQDKGSHVCLTAWLQQRHYIIFGYLIYTRSNFLEFIEKVGIHWKP